MIPTRVIVPLTTLLFLLFACTAIAESVDITEVSKISPPIQVAVDCFDSMLRNDYDSFFSTLHPQIIEKSGGEKKIKELFDVMVKQLKNVKVKLDPKKPNILRSGKYLINFIMYMPDGKDSNIITVSKTQNGWKTIDI